MNDEKTWRVEIRWFDDGEEPTSWERIPRKYATQQAAEKAAIRIEIKNAQNGACCTARVVDISTLTDAGDIQQ